MRNWVIQLEGSLLLVLLYSSYRLGCQLVLLEYLHALDSTSMWDLPAAGRDLLFAALGGVELVDDLSLLV